MQRDRSSQGEGRWRQVLLSSTSCVAKSLPSTLGGRGQHFCSVHKQSLRTHLHDGKIFKLTSDVVACSSKFGPVVTTSLRTTTQNPAGTPLQPCAWAMEGGLGLGWPVFSLYCFGMPLRAFSSPPRPVPLLVRGHM
jgi:hypothetical protein